ncbi:uncharacterized protein LOC114828410 [Galendromus occidentalis]|uniref:Uncharacterized protein LOC114828410 n=1 Tax=Galendromus occidentalis TaxID=34638 RepID=A0AAJ7WIF5_9ACAR|nr:uncharacterized protein LOC114828410 [Galendromus occidentalis]
MAEPMQGVEGDVVNPQQLQVVQVLGDCALVGNDSQHILLDPDQADYDIESPEVGEEGGSRKRSRKPLLALSVREKTAICRYKAQHPQSNQRQIAEHFTKLWGKDICRRRVSDILVQKDKWFDVERRVKGDADKTFRDGKFAQLEKHVFDWVTEVARSGGRLWDEDIRRTAKRMAEMQDVKSFVASAGWLSGFKRRYGLKAVEEGGDIQLDFAPEPSSSEFSQRDENQIQLQGNDGQQYTVNITVDNPPHAQQQSQPSISMTSQMARNAVVEDANLSDIETGESGDEEQDPSITIQPQNLNNPAVNGEQNMALDDLVKTIIYGGSSTSAQVMTAAATQAALSQDHYQDTAHNGSGSPPLKGRAATRAKMTAVLVRKVLVATKRKLDAEADMIREQRQRHFYEGKMLEEKRRRLVEERELIAAQKRKLDNESKYLQEQQRNEVIRRELLLADVSAARGQGNLKQNKVHSAAPVPIAVNQPKASYVTLVTGSSE